MVSFFETTAFHSSCKFYDPAELVIGDKDFLPGEAKKILFSRGLSSMPQQAGYE